VSLDPGRLRAALAACLAAVPRPPSGLALACSGGRDSLVLLDLLAAEGRPGQVLRVLHVDHRLQAGSGDWAQACAVAAARYGLECRTLVVDGAGQPGASPEAAAREARYAALAGELRSDEVLLTAHHADDQLETVLLQLLRGGGARAACGMPALAAFAAGWHARPLLGFTRAELAGHASAAGLAWVEDPSNVDPRFDRNYLRARVLPALLERWPAASTTVGRVARLTAETVQLAEQVARQDLSGLRRGRALDLASWQGLSSARRRAALRTWLVARDLPLPTERQLLALEHDLSAAAPDRVPCCAWPGARVWRYRGHLHAEAVDRPAREAPLAIDWDGQGTLAWPPGGRLQLQPTVGEGLSRERLPAQLRVATRRGGERFEWRRGQPRALHKWLQERGVLPWRRDSLPLLWAGRELVAVADLACAGSLAAAPGEPSLRLAWLDAPVVTEQATFV
jgi:tRNA(Ile)-lysidine synthase